MDFKRDLTTTRHYFHKLATLQLPLTTPSMNSFSQLRVDSGFIKEYKLIRSVNTHSAYKGIAKDLIPLFGFNSKLQSVKKAEY